MNYSIGQSSPSIKAFFACANGLGDKFLDVIGVHVLCDYLGYEPKIQFNKGHTEYFDWGTNQYDLRLFCDIPAFSPTPETECRRKIIAQNASSTLCPFKVYQFLYDNGVPIDFGELNQKYREYAKGLIRPSAIIEERLPSVLKGAYGIHLRKSDKIKSSGIDIRHENKLDEFGIIIENLLDDIKVIIENEPEPAFLVVSEDEAWKKTIIEMIVESAEGKPVEIVVLDYSNPESYENFESVLDMFALSRCKTIFQGVKYTSYSILAALIGGSKLVNYSPKLECNTECLIYTWNSVVEINGEYIENSDILSYITNGIQNLRIV